MKQQSNKWNKYMRHMSSLKKIWWGFHQMRKNTLSCHWFLTKQINKSIQTKRALKQLKSTLLCLMSSNSSIKKSTLKAFGSWKSGRSRSKHVLRPQEKIWKIEVTSSNWNWSKKSRTSKNKSLDGRLSLKISRCSMILIKPKSSKTKHSYSMKNWSSPQK